MAALGVLHPTREGGWVGLIFLMAHEVKVRLVPNDNQTNPNAPAFRLFAGEAELGAAWPKQTHDEEPREYLGGEMDFPGLPEPMSFAVFFIDEGTKARVLWNRRKAA